MDTLLDNFSSEKLYPNSNLLDLEDLNETDFLTNVHFTDHMEDFSHELLSSFFDEQLLAEQNPLMDMELDTPSPDIQAEHSYSLSGDSAPQSPSQPIKTDEDTESEGMWSFGQDLTAVLVKQEPSLLADAPPPPSAPPSLDQPLCLAPPPKKILPEEKASREPNAVREMKAEPPDVGRFPGTPPDVGRFPGTPPDVGRLPGTPPDVGRLPGTPPDVGRLPGIPSDEQVQLPPTPPSSHGNGSDSDGSQSPRSLPPPSPAHLQARTSAAISSSPLLTAPHKLQGTSGPLILTEEEKRTLIAEGYPIPNKLPLSKTEEKALKRVRRKIKNKISAQESRRKKKEYLECLEKKVESFTSENNQLWKKVETLESTNRSLLQQLQKLQVLLAGKVPQSSKMASSQTGTCLMVVALCFLLVLGSIMPCLPEFSSVTHTVKSSPLLSVEVYTATQIRSRTLLFYNEGSRLEESYGRFLKVEDDSNLSEGQPDQDTPSEHEAGKYLSRTRADSQDYNQTGVELPHEKEQYHKREGSPDGGAEFF